MKDKSDISLHSLDKSGSGVEVEVMQNTFTAGAGAFQPHRHDHYTCLLLEEGEVELLVDFKTISLGPGDLFVSYAGQVHQLVSWVNARGYYISFDHRIIEKGMSVALERLLSEQLFLSLDDRQLHWYKNIIRSLTDLPATNDLRSSRRIVERSLIGAFVSQVVSNLQTTKVPLEVNQASRSYILRKKFLLLLREKFAAYRRPSDYAASLQVSVSYLNDSIKHSTGLSVTSHIHNELLKEAQRLLLFTDLSVKEVAFQLGYQDHKYFNRFFHKETGTSPGEYRRPG